MVNTEKIIKYNHILFAILGTLAVIGVAFILVISAMTLAQGVDQKTPEKNGNGVSDKNASAQGYSQIKMLEPRLVDEALHLFIIPISQEKPEEPIALNSMRSYASYSPSRLNNLVLYNHATKTKQLVVDTHTLITRYAYKKTKDKKWILFLGAQADTNQNNQLDTEDKMSLYWYTIDSHELNKAAVKNSIVSFDLSETIDSSQIKTKGINPNEVIIQVKQNVGSSVYHILNLDNGNVRKIVPDSLMKTIQDILDLGKG